MAVDRACWWVIAIFFAGCNFPEPMVRDTPPGGSPDGGNAAPDQDSDGVSDMRDNCRTIVNPRQYDEDADAVGDACDNCPHVANAGQENVGESNAGNSADTVGDACDPRPMATGDSIAMFVGFHEAADFNDWQVAGDQNFTVTGGVLRNTMNNNIGLAWRNNANLQGATLVTKVKYTSLSTNYRFKGFAIVGNFSRTGMNGNTLGLGAGCGEMRDMNVNAGAPFYNAVDFQGSAFNNSATVSNAQLAIDQVSIYQATVDSDSVDCRKGTDTWSRNVDRSGSGLALSAWGAGVDIEYIVAFRSPN